MFQHRTLLFVRLKRAWLLAALGVCLSLTGLSAEEQLHIVLSAELEPYQVTADSIKKGVPDQSCTVHLVQDLQKQQVDGKAFPAGTFVAVGSSAAVYLHQHLSGVSPYVYCMVSQPDERGLFEGHASLGVRTDMDMTERFRLLQALMPEAKRIGFLYWSAEDEPEYLRDARAVLPSTCELVAHGINDQRQAARAIKAMLQDQVDVVLAVPDRRLMTVSTIRTLLRKALDKRVPVCGYSASFVKAGAAFGFSVEPERQGEQAAVLIKHLCAIGNGETSALPAQIKHADATHKCLDPRIRIAVNNDVVKRLGVVFKPDVVKDVIYYGRLK